jgi:hypothetical protein
MKLVLANEPTALRRRAYFYCVDATDGITPETGEAAGQPQVSLDGAAWTDTGVGTLTHIGNGRYYADLTQTLVDNVGSTIGTRYKSANTTETVGDSFQIVAFNPFDSVRLGLTSLPNAAADAAGGLPISDAGGLNLDTQLAATNEITSARMAALTDWIDGGRLDLLLDAIPTTPMRGTDGANTVVPDAAGTAAGLHAITDALVTSETTDVETAITNSHVATDALITAVSADALAVLNIYDESKQTRPGGTYPIIETDDDSGVYP